MNQSEEQRLIDSQPEIMAKVACQRTPQVAERTIHYTDLPEDTSGSPLAAEWNCYRREAGRLLAEGHEGDWVLLKGEALVGIWKTHEEAYAVALERYWMQPVLIHQILTQEPVLRGPTLFRLCRS